MGEWHRVEDYLPDSAPDTPSPTKQLCLCLQRQAPGEPMHWCLCACAAASGQTVGRVWQVTGDATFMIYQAIEEADVIRAPDHHTHYALADGLTATEEDLVDRVAHDESPPYALDRRSVRENCQHWTMRVIRRLAEQGLVDQRKVDAMERLVEPIDG